MPAQSTDRSTAQGSSLKVALLLASAVALGPFTIDTYLPAFPQIAADIGVGIHQVSLTISVYMFTLAFGQLVGGPLSDRFGRMPVMMIGLAIYIVASLMLSLSDSLDALIFWRVLQAFGGGWTSVTVPAIVRDRCEGLEAARLYSMIGLIMVIAPAIAPTVGSTILTVSSWRGVFVFLSVYAALVGVWLWFGLFSKNDSRKTGKTEMESKAQATAAASVSASQPDNIRRRYLSVLKQPMALRFIVIQAMVFSVMLIFLTHASFIYQQWFGLSAYAFSILFAGNIMVMASMNVIGRRLLAKFQPVQIVKLAVAMQALSVLVLVGIVLTEAGLVFFAPALMFSVGSLGAVAPNIQASYMQFFSRNSGTASALLGAIPMTITGLISAFSTWLSDDTLNPIVLLMLVCVVLGLGLVWRAPMILRKLQADSSRR